MQTQTTTQNPSPVAAVFTAEVEDFPAWKKGFDANVEFRRQAGITFSHINHDIENPRLLTIYLGGSDEGRVRAFVTNPELGRRMQQAGVKGNPVPEFFCPVENKTRGEAMAAAIVRHRVPDFDTWKALFDRSTEARAGAGIVGHGISRKLDDPNLVVVYLQATSVEKLQTFLSSPELAEKMKAGGIEKPTVSFVHGEEPQH